MVDAIKYVLSVLYTVFKFIENCFIIPVKKLWKFCGPFTNWYSEKWNKYTHDKYGDFLYKKAAVMIAVTIVSLYVALGVAKFTFDLCYYLCTKKVETIYLSDSVELDSDASLWGVKGCPTKDCDSDTALYFRIKITWFHAIWNLWTHHSIFFPDGIAAGIPTGQSKCEVLSYGLRYRIVMIWNFYPQILQVKCVTQ